MLNKSKNLTLLFFLTILIAGGSIFAGTISNNSIPAPTGYTLDDIYNLIQNNTIATETNHQIYPTINTGEASFHSLSSVYNALTNLIKRENLRTGAIYLGVTGDYGNPDDPGSYGGELETFNPEPHSVGYTLDDIYNFITSNTVAIAGAHSFSPSSTPTSSLHSISDIYNALKPGNFILASDIATGTAYLGVVGTYEETLVEPRTLYFKHNQAEPDYAWDTVANWWTDTGCTVPAGSIPNDSDTIYIANSVGSGPSSSVTLEHIYVADPITGEGIFPATFTGAIGNATFNQYSANMSTITGNAEFTGNSHNSNNGGVVTGNAVFRDNSLNDNVVNNDATFYNNSVNDGIVSGNALFDNDSDNTGTVSGNATFRENARNQESGVITGDADVYYPSQKPIGGTVGGTVTYYDYPVESTYTVTFDSRSGSEVLPISGIESGSTITLPSEPTRENYTFNGWYSEINGGGDEFNEESIVSSDIIVYAKWTANFDKLVTGDGDYYGSSPNGAYTYNGEDEYGSTYIGPLINPGSPMQDRYYIAYWGDEWTGSWYVGAYHDTFWDGPVGWSGGINGVYSPRESRVTGEVIVSDP
jgi:uncharacterized repeat protein (TIGR02543 family)